MSMQKNNGRKLADFTGKPPSFFMFILLIFLVFLFVNVCFFVECSSESISSYMLNMDEVEP